MYLSATAALNYTATITRIHLGQLVFEEIHFSNWIHEQVQSHSSKVIINNYVNDSDETETDCENETNNETYLVKIIEIY